MLKKESKLKATDFLKLKKQGKRVYSTLFSITYLADDKNRFAVTISKKIYKNAFDRNRAKRKIFAVLSHISPNKTGMYEIFIKNKINDIHNDLLKEDLEKVLCQK